MSTFWSKLFSKRNSNPELSRKDLAKEMKVPIRTLNYNIAQQDKRVIDETTAFFESKAGEVFLKRLVVSTIYTFCLKGGIGAGRVEDFFESIRISSHVGISESSILRLLQEVEQHILAYKQLVETDIEASKAYQQDLQVVLGLDETWLDEMLLVCQDLVSGYLFLKSNQRVETPAVGGQD